MENIKCGWYKIEFNNNNDLYEEWKNLNNGMRFGKWLRKCKLIKDEYLEEIINSVNIDSVKLSNSKSDILRIGKSKNYDSCLGGIFNGQITHYIMDKDIYIVYAPDKSGDFLWRSVLRLSYDLDGSKCFISYKPYGNGDSKLILNRLSSYLNMKIYPANDCKKDGKRVFLSSVTAHVNSRLLTPVYSGAKTKVTSKSRLSIEVIYIPY